MKVKYQTGLAFSYPDKDDAHMINPKAVRHVDLDGHFPYYNRSWWFRFWQNMLNFLFLILIIPSCYLRYGLKVKGRKYKHGFYAHLLKGSFLTTCNHVFEWDYICVRAAMAPRRGYFLMWKNNHDSSLGKVMRVVGSIPISTRFDGMKKMDQDLKLLFKDKRWLHIYPEGSMWYYEEKIRPFKRGTFSLAYDYHLPIFPLVISYRPAKGIFRLWKRHGYPCVTISIGEPQYPNLCLDRNESISEIKTRIHQIMEDMKEHETPLISLDKQTRINKKAHI